MKKRRARAQLIADINMVPYLDVLLVLLIIFMMTAPFLQQGIQIDVPRVDSAPLVDDQTPTVTVSIDEFGHYYLQRWQRDPVPISFDDLALELQHILRYAPETLALLQADHRIDYGQVMQAMARMQTAGVSQIGLITAPTVQQRDDD
jgi:biopolymer transport protein TolR